MNFCCPICQSKNIKELFTDNYFKYYKCKNCSVIFKKKISDEFSLKNYYSNILSNDEKTEATPISILNQIITKILEKRCNISKNDFILDYGCGSGNLLRILKDKNYKNIYGIEPYNTLNLEKDIAIFRHLKEIPENIKFDIILMIEVLEHIENPYNILDKLFFRLKKGGYLFLTTPNLNSLKAKFLKFNWKEIQRPSHLILYNKTSLKMLFKKYPISSLTFIKDIYYTDRKFFEDILNIFFLTGNIKILLQKS